DALLGGAHARRFCNHWLLFFCAPRNEERDRERCENHCRARGRDPRNNAYRGLSKAFHVKTIPFECVSESISPYGLDSSVAVRCIFLLTLLSNDFIYESHCGLFTGSQI